MTIPVLRPGFGGVVKLDELAFKDGFQRFRVVVFFGPVPDGGRDFFGHGNARVGQDQGFRKSLENLLARPSGAEDLPETVFPGLPGFRQAVPESS